MGGTILNAKHSEGSSEIEKNYQGTPRKRGRSLIVDHKRGRPAGTPRTEREIANQKAAIAKSREAGTWRSGGYKQMRRTERT